MTKLIPIVMLAISSIAFAEGENSCIPKSELLATQKTVVNSDGSVTIQNPFVNYKGKKSSLSQIEYNGYSYTKQEQALVCKLFGFAGGMSDIDTRKVTDKDDKSSLLLVSDYVGEGVPKRVHVRPFADDLKTQVITAITCIN